MIGLSGLITPSLDEMVHVAKEMERQGLQPAAADRRRDHQPQAHRGEDRPGLRRTRWCTCSDASRAVGVVGQLLQPESLAELDRTNRERQQQMREAHAGKSQADPPAPLAQARERRPRLDHGPGSIATPEFTGRRMLDEIPLGELRELIDWSPFFHAWELRGVYPRILDDDKFGEAARELFDNANRLLDTIIDENRLRAQGVYGFYPANADGEDIVLWTDESRSDEATRFHMLRQQVAPRDKPCRSLADFVAPTGVAEDHIGAFAVTAGIGIDALVAGFEKAGDDYGSIMAKALADRLAEAAAEWLHRRVRREWGYGVDEQLSIEDLIKERYRGIRPAAGYPACPDHTEKRTLFRLLDGESAGISLTESFAMLPAASVSGLYFAHPEARYFAIGRIGRDQIEDYAARKNISVAEAERWLSPNLDYEPSDFEGSGAETSAALPAEPAADRK